MQAASRLRRLIDTHGTINWGARPVLFIAALYLLSSFLQSPIEDSQLADVPHIRFGDFALALPMVLTGDSPHYLLIVNSIIEDGDVDLANNYRGAANGQWQAGARFRGIALDHHTEKDSHGKERSLHSIYLPLLLSFVAWPFRGTQWVEPVCILLTLVATVAALLVFARRSGLDGRWVAPLALATPLWCYARDIWTEPWLAVAWIGLLCSSSLPVIFAFGLAGTLIKYNFMVVPISMAVVLWLRGERRRAWVLAASGILGILIAIATAQYLFRDVDHFSLFHLGGHLHATFRQKIVPLRPHFVWLIAILLHPQSGLLPFFPFLAWGLWQLRKGGPVFVPAIVFLLLHGAYPGWHGGVSFSARYLVPLLPALVVAVASSKPRGWLFAAALAYSGLWGVLAGICPGLAYNHTPVQIVLLVWKHLVALVGG